MDEGRNKAVNVFLQSAVSYVRANGKKIFKLFVFLAAALFVVILMPKSHSFKYDFNKRPGMALHDDLNAPFDFALVKTDDSSSGPKGNSYERQTAIISCTAIRWHKVSYRNSMIISRRCFLATDALPCVRPVVPYSVI